MTPFDIQSPLPARKPNLENEAGDTANTALPERPLRVEHVEQISEPMEVASSIKAKRSFHLPGWTLWALIVLVILIIGVVAFRVLIPSLSGTPPVVERKLVYWGLWEQKNVMAGVIEEFEKSNPGVKVIYSMVPKKDYRSRLQARLAKDSSSGEEIPDVFRIHSSWLPMFGKDLEPVPNATATSIGLEADFHKVYSELKVAGRYVAVPLMYDNLALFYNKKILESAQVTSLPKTWWGLERLARKLTVKDEKGQISTAGVAMGTTGNVDHWSDIIGLLLKQNGVNPYLSDATNTDKLKNILTFYSLFKTKDATWDETFANSTNAFAQGRVALYFGPSWRVFDIQAINPGLEFEVTNVPQLPTLEGVDPAAIESGEASANLSEKQWATYWAEGVSKNSPNKDLAFKFLEFLAQKEQLTKVYTAASQIRSFGPIYPRKSMLPLLTSEKKVAPFASVADNASSWYLSSFTHDAGLNERMIKYFEDAVNAMNSRETTNMDEVVKTLQSGIVQLQNQYSLTITP